MQYEVDREEDGAGEPSIAEMTEKAIKILQKNSKGYFVGISGQTRRFRRKNQTVRTGRDEENALFSDNPRVNTLEPLI